MARIHNVLSILFDSAKLALLFVCGLFVFSELLMALHVSIAPWFVPLWYLLTLCLGFILSRRNNQDYTKERAKQYLYTMALFTATLLLCMLDAAFAYDLTYDGQWYHLDAIIALKDGWNCVWGMLSPDQMRFSNECINHYPKASWITSSAIFSFTNAINTTKTVQLLMAVVSFVFLLKFLREDEQMRWRWALPTSFFSAFSPNTLIFLHSNMIDGLMYSMLIIVGVLIYRWTKQGCKMDESFWLLFLATVFSLNLKFNGVVYVVICYVAAFVILLLQKQWRTTLARYTIITSLMVIVGLAAFGYPTYVRNTIFGGHPFYPLYGNKKFAKEIADIITPKNMQSENRFRKWEMSTFSEPVYLDNNGVTVYRRIFDPTILINIFSDKYHVYARGSAKVAGFGPLSAECFYIAVVVLILSLIFVSFKTQREMMLIIFFLLLSIFIIAECWYARYVPQQWLIVGLTTVLAYRHRHKKMFLYAGTLLMFYASANTLSVGTGIEVVQIIEDRIINKQIDELKSCNDTATIFPSWVTSFEYRLKENNISYKYETDSLLASTFNMFEGTLAVHPRYKPCK